jgi:hypothetical protein
MALEYGFFNAVKQTDGTYDRVYNAEQMSRYFNGLVSPGVYESVGGGLQVRAGTGMTVQVQTGRAILGDNCQWLDNDAVLDIVLNAAHVTLNRYTAIVMRLDYTNRNISIVAVDGANATAPTKPAMTRTSAIMEYCLAYVYVGKGVTTITQSAITDTRPDNTVCGWVTGLVQQVDTSQLFLQWQTAYAEFYAQMQAWQTQQEAAFDAWFSTLTGQLQVNTYIQEYRNTVSVTTSATQVSIGISQYVPTTDILIANLNGIALVEGTDYSISGTGTGAKMTLTKAIDGNNVIEFRVLKSKIGQQTA